MPPTVSEAINHGRRAISQLEPAILSPLLDEYEAVWRLTERRIQAFEAQIVDAQRAGQTVRPSWVRQQTWYRQLQASIDDQFIRFNHTALTTIVRGQSQAVGISAESTALFRQAVGIETSLAGRVNAGAFERWVSAIQPDSPIRGVIERYQDRTRDAILRHVTDGIGGGQGVGQIVRNITKDAGPDAQVGQLQTTVRTETMRAYRGSSRDGFEAIGPDVIDEWEWMATKSRRTCLACLAMDGRRFPYDQYPDRFHVACRCVIRPIPHANLVPGALPQRELGSDWLARQDKKAQRQVIGTQGRWKLYQDGAPLTDFVGIKRSRTWGDSLYVKPAGTVDVSGRSSAPSVPVFTSAEDVRRYFSSIGVDVTDVHGDMDIWQDVAAGYRREIDTGRSVPSRLEFITGPKNGNYAQYAYRQSDPGDGWIQVNVNSPYWTAKDTTRSRLKATEWLVDETPEGIVAHEVGHWRHFQGVTFQPGGKFTVNDQTFSGRFKKAEKTTSAKVSQYATQHPLEFIAETYSGLRGGKKFDDDVMALYKLWGGPDV